MRSNAFNTKSRMESVPAVIEFDLVFIIFNTSYSIVKKKELSEIFSVTLKDTGGFGRCETCQNAM